MKTRIYRIVWNEVVVGTAYNFNDAKRIAQTGAADTGETHFVTYGGETVAEFHWED